MTIDLDLAAAGRDGDAQNADRIRGQVRIQVADGATAHAIKAVFERACQDAAALLPRPLERPLDHRALFRALFKGKRCPTCLDLLDNGTPLVVTPNLLVTHQHCARRK